MRIGIDFDDTIAGYDDMFAHLARRTGLIDGSFLGGKHDLRETLRGRERGELTWQRLQGRVSGAGVAGARLIDGAGAFLRRCRGSGQQVFVVSHKTEYGNDHAERINLRQAAYDWMTSQGFLPVSGGGLSREAVFFEGTRAEKVARTAELPCAVFIDDLEEVLSAPAFPTGVRRILLAGTRSGDAEELVYCGTRAEISEAVFHADG